jgi:hypothetical protein
MLTSYFTEYAEVSYDIESTIENWMIAPFEDVTFERDLLIEEWMIKPFNPLEEEGEEELCIEEWMTTALWE